MILSKTAYISHTTGCYDISNLITLAIVIWKDSHSLRVMQLTFLRSNTKVRIPLSRSQRPPIMIININNFFVPMKYCYDCRVTLYNIYEWWQEAGVTVNITGDCWDELHDTYSESSHADLVSNIGCYLLHIKGSS